MIEINLWPASHPIRSETVLRAPSIFENIIYIDLPMAMGHDPHAHFPVYIEYSQGRTIDKNIINLTKMKRLIVNHTSFMPKLAFYRPTKNEN